MVSKAVILLTLLPISASLHPTRVCQFDSLLRNWTFSFARGNWKRSSHVIGLQRFIQTMRAIQGALIVASTIQIILGYSQVWGLFSRYIASIWKCEVVSPPMLDYIVRHCCLGFPCRFFSPLGMAPVVALVGLGLFQRGFPLVGIAIL